MLLQAWVFTTFPENELPDMLAAKDCRKFVSVAVLLEPPNELIKFWKLCSKELCVELVVVDVDALEVVEPKLWIRLCKSACILGRGGLALLMLLLASLSPSLSVPCVLDVPLLWDCRAAIRFCMKLASA